MGEISHGKTGPKTIVLGQKRRVWLWKRKVWLRKKSVVAEEESVVRAEESVGEEDESVMSEGENAVQGQDDTMDVDGMDFSTLNASNVLSLLRIEGGDSASTM